MTPRKPPPSLKSFVRCCSSFTVVLQEAKRDRDNIVRRLIRRRVNQREVIISGSGCCFSQKVFLQFKKVII